MEEERKFYRVRNTIDGAPLRDHLLHGYETRRDFSDALRHLVEMWSGRVGECVAERHGFMRLRFHDTPGGRPDEEWLPPYLLDPAEMPDYLKPDDTPEIEKELDEIFAFR